MKALGYPGALFFTYMDKLIIVPLGISIFFLLDWYVYQSIRALNKDWQKPKKDTIRGIYWIISAITLCVFVFYHSIKPSDYSLTVQQFILAFIFINYIGKFLAIFPLVVDDARRLYRLIIDKSHQKSKDKETPEKRGKGLPGEPIPRSKFLAKSALIAGGIPILTLSYGIVSGAHDYRIRRLRIKLPHLPKAYDGIRIAQLSDIHSGSFFNKTAVIGGVEMLQAEKPDMIFFTGDLVNNITDEVKDYIPVFSKLSAPMGIYSTLGNHDYGDYKRWSSEQDKAKNFQGMLDAHKALGWKLLRNEHEVITSSGDPLAIIGVENWGQGRFAKYGDLEKAYRGTEDIPVKLLLSHDPSHWDAEVRPGYSDIDLTFSGHTHGFQFGIEIPQLKWSPSQYLYEQWAGLYQKGSQYIYVNRGFGYIGYPGRIGMPPEITIIELVRA